MMVFAYLTVLITLVFGVQWLINIRMLSKWKHNKLLFTLNATLFIIYMFYLIYGNPPFIGQDEYGIQRLWFIIFIPIMHIVINLLLILIISWRYK